MIIAVEGLDGTGKGTFIEFLKAQMEYHGQKCVVMRQPGGTEAAEALRNILKGSNINLVSELFVVGASFSEGIEQIKSWERDGYVVIMDRSFYSTYAYQVGTGFKTLQGAENKAAKRVLLGLWKVVLGMVEEILPDSVIYLHAPIETSLQRIGKSVEHGDDKFDDDVDRLIGIKETYDWLFKTTQVDHTQWEPLIKQLIRVDTNHSLEKVERMAKEIATMIVSQEWMGWSCKQKCKTYDFPRKPRSFILSESKGK